MPAPTLRARSPVRKWAPSTLAAILLVVAFASIHRDLQVFSIAEIIGELASIPGGRVAAALALTLVGYGALAFYDVLGVAHVGAPLSKGRAALASATSYAFSQSLGFPLLTGGSIRYRFYSSWGLEAPDIARIVAFASSGFWLGFLALAGATFQTPSLVLPDGLSRLQPAVRPLGWLSLAAIIAYLVACRTGRAISLGRWTLRAPRLGVAALQIGVATVDWAASAAVLWVLLPAGVAPSLPAFVGVYLVAQVVGVGSHVPGGIGVFEAIVIGLLEPTAADPGLVASLVVFRAIYYLLPLLLATVLLGVLETARRRTWIGRTATVLGEGVSSVVPMVAAGAVFATGGILLASGALPFGRHPLGAGRIDLLPVVEAAHFLGSVAGAVLLVLAWGLSRRLDGAFHATLVVLGASAVLALLRGAGWATALIPGFVLVGLLPARKEFFRRSSLTVEPLSAEWMLGIGGVVLATGWLGFFAYREVTYSNELWWRFALDEDAPRFLRGAVGGSLILLVFAVARLLRPAPPREMDGAERPSSAIREIVAASAESRAHLALLGDKRFLMSASGRSFIMYGVQGRAWISMGDPVGDPAEVRELVWSFRDRVHLYDGWTVFYQVAPTHLSTYVDAGLGLIKLGEEAIVDIPAFSLEGSARSALRRTIRKLEREGARFSVIPAASVPPLLPRLRNVSERWLADRSVREKRFSLGSFSEGYLASTPMALVQVGDRIVAFANLWEGAPGSELSIDLMRYDPDAAPVDTMLYLLTQSMLWAGQRGYRRFSLGMAPLSGLEGGPLGTFWSRLGSAVFRYGEHFYSFQGLRAFKEKWNPTWEPRYVASPGGAAIPAVLTDVSLLISGGVIGMLSR